MKNSAGSGLVVGSEVDKISNSTNSNDLRVGSWYWVKHKERDCKTGEQINTESLACCMHVGSNFAELRTPFSYYWKIHDSKWGYLSLELEPENYFQQQIAAAKQKIVSIQLQIQEKMQEIGLMSENASQQGQANSGHELVAFSRNKDIDVYKQQLKTTEAELPKLFEQIQSTTKDLAIWSGASLLPMKAAIAKLEEKSSGIKDLVFNLQIYGGITEEVLQCRVGITAKVNDKLHIMQRMLFMDEESLLGYKAGGLEYSNIGDFNEWLCEDENLNRLLPHPRCMVAMRVRRNSKNRDQLLGGDSLSQWIKISLEQSDKLTFLYIRNGENVYMLQTEIEFKEQIFPEIRDLNLYGEMMVQVFAGKAQDIISKADWELNIKNSNSKFYDWEEFTPDSVYFDQAVELLNNKMKEANRISLIVQGVFDRSDMLQPHAPVKLWDADSFTENVVLAFDSSRGLNYGEKPDFEAYRKKLNESLDIDSYVVGQRQAWIKSENLKVFQKAQYGNSSARFYCADDEGCPQITRMSKWNKKSGRAMFEWQQLSASWSKTITKKFTASVDDILNISAYKKGDFKQFFNDPRTRGEYLKWAHLLLAAEDWVQRNESNN